MSKHAPFFRWFPKDYASDARVIAMTDDQDLAYRRMIDASWELGALPSDPVKLAAIVRFDLERFERAWTYPLTDCWHRMRRNKGLVNLRLEEERAEMMSRSQKGREAADRRWKMRRKLLGIREKDATCVSNADAMPEPCYPKPKPKPTNSDPTKDLTYPPNANDPIEITGSRAKKPAPRHPLNGLVRWDKNARKVRFEEGGRETLFSELAGTVRDEGLRGPLTKQEMHEGWGRLNGHLIGNPFKTSASTLPAIVLNWFENDLRRKNNSPARGKPLAQRIDEQARERMAPDGNKAHGGSGSDDDLQRLTIRNFRRDG